MPHRSLCHIDAMCPIALLVPHSPPGCPTDHQCTLDCCAPIDLFPPQFPSVLLRSSVLHNSMCTPQVPTPQRTPMYPICPLFPISPHRFLHPIDPHMPHNPPVHPIAPHILPSYPRPTFPLCPHPLPLCPTQTPMPAPQNQGLYRSSWDGEEHSWGGGG